MSEDDILKKGMLRLQKDFAQDSFRNVVQCWWLGKSVDCNGIFANKQLDFGVCFTLVTDKGLARLIESMYYFICKLK